MHVTNPSVSLNCMLCLESDKIRSAEMAENIFASGTPLLTGRKVYVISGFH